MSELRHITYVRGETQLGFSFTFVCPFQFQGQCAIFTDPIGRNSMSLQGKSLSRKGPKVRLYGAESFIIPSPREHVFSNFSRHTEKSLVLDIPKDSASLGLGWRLCSSYVFAQSAPSGVPRPTVLTSPGSLLETQNLRLYARPTESKPTF